MKYRTRTVKKQQSGELLPAPKSFLRFLFAPENGPRRFGPDFGTWINWKDLQLAIWLQIGYNASCLRETNSDKEVSKMFFCGNTCCNTDCSSIWQILSQICGFGC